MTTDEHERIELIETLSNLVPEQLEKIIWRLKAPNDVIPPFEATQGQRVFKLLY